MVVFQFIFGMLVSCATEKGWLCIFVWEKPPLQSKFTLLQSNFSRQIFLFQNTKEKFGGKKITLQKSEFTLQRRKVHLFGVVAISRKYFKET
jgi:hypothetical protein